VKFSLSALPLFVAQFGYHSPCPSVFEGYHTMTVTEIILVQIQSLGYIVKTFRVNGTVEMHAVDLACERDSQIARCNDGDGPEEEYRCACLLAAAVGIRVGGL
jgi:hypothetical protein